MSVDAPKSVFFSKSDYAYAELKRRIVTGELPPGSKLDLEVLAQGLAVSRMPIREALHRLRAQGLVEIHPQRATQVAPLSIADMVDIYDARCALEGLMAERAAAAAQDADIRALAAEVDRQTELLESADLEVFLASDRAFHYRLFAIPQAPRTFELLKTLRDLTERYIHLYLAEPRLQAGSVAEHREMVGLCELHDVEGLVAAARSHILRGKQRLLELLPTLIERDEEVASVSGES